MKQDDTWFQLASGLGSVHGFTEAGSKLRCHTDTVRSFLFKDVLKTHQSSKGSSTVAVLQAREISDREEVLSKHVVHDGKRS